MSMQALTCLEQYVCGLLIADVIPAFFQVLYHLTREERWDAAHEVWPHIGADCRLKVLPGLDGVAAWPVCELARKY